MYKMSLIFQSENRADFSAEFDRLFPPVFVVEFRCEKRG